MPYLTAQALTPRQVGRDREKGFRKEKSMRFVVIGGDAAGMSAASRAKRNAPSIDVVVLEQTQDVSYSACGMPYAIADGRPAARRTGGAPARSLSPTVADFIQCDLAYAPPFSPVWDPLLTAANQLFKAL